MIESRSFTIRPNGVIKGGVASYSLDPDAGMVRCQGEVYLPRFIPNKKFGPTDYPVDLKLLSAENLTSIGDVVTMGQWVFRVIRLSFDQVTTDVCFNGVSYGWVIFDRTGKILRLVFVSVQLKVPVLGGLLIEADAAPMGFFKNMFTRFQCLFS